MLFLPKERKSEKTKEKERSTKENYNRTRIFIWIYEETKLEKRKGSLALNKNLPRKHSGSNGFRYVRIFFYGLRL